MVATGRDGGAGPARRPTSPGGGAGDIWRRHLEQGARLDRFDAHARLGWGGAVALIDGAADGSAVGLAVAAYRHHRRLELRTLHPAGAEPPWTASADLEGLPLGGCRVRPGRKTATLVAAQDLEQRVLAGGMAISAFVAHAHHAHDY